MKRNSTTFRAAWLAIFLLLPFAPALAQDNPEEDVVKLNAAHNHILKIHPLQLGEIYFSHEKQRTENVSNEFGLSYIYRSYLKGDEWLPDGKKVNGIGIRMSQRHYTIKKQEAPFGFFHGPVFGYRFMVFEKNALNLTEQEDAAHRHANRLYQNSMDLSYQIGGQFLLSRHLTMEIAGMLGGRVKYAYSAGSGELLPDHIIGHSLRTSDNAAVLVMPLPQLTLSVGYSF